METLLIVLPLALLFVAAALVVFRWAVRTGQFDDLDTPPLRMLFDDTPRTGPAGGTSGGGERQDPPLA